jgi:hypothetical protein
LYICQTVLLNKDLIVPKIRKINMNHRMKLILIGEKLRKCTLRPNKLPRNINGVILIKLIHLNTIN